MVQYGNVCFAFTTCCLAVTLLLPTKAERERPLNFNDLLEDERSRMTKDNYMVDGKPYGDAMDVAYAVESLYREAPPPRDLPPRLQEAALVVDYANMISNDQIILLDNSVETRTRKRGNIKVKKQNQQSLKDTPCSCVQMVSPHTFGSNAFPRHMNKKLCNKNLCSLGHKCVEQLYNVTVFRRNDGDIPESATIIRAPIVRSGWIATMEPVVIGCSCVNNFVDTSQ